MGSFLAFDFLAVWFQILDNIKQTRCMNKIPAIAVSAKQSLLP